MATIGIQSIATCAGTNHVTVEVRVNGTLMATFLGRKEDLTATSEESEIVTAARLLVRAHAIGKTPAQVASNLAVGLTILV